MVRIFECSFSHDSFSDVRASGYSLTDPDSDEQCSQTQRCLSHTVQQYCVHVIVGTRGGVVVYTGWVGKQLQQAAAM